MDLGDNDLLDLLLRRTSPAGARLARGPRGAAAAARRRSSDAAVSSEFLLDLSSEESA
jgi:hypothetical protein